MFVVVVCCRDEPSERGGREKKRGGGGGSRPLGNFSADVGLGGWVVPPPPTAVHSYTGAGPKKNFSDQFLPTNHLN